MVALLFDGVGTFELGIVTELFGLSRPELDDWYSFRTAAVERGPVRAVGGIRIEASHTLRALDGAGTIIVPGWRPIEAQVPQNIVRKIRRAYEEGARIMSVCSGAFVLGAAGLLDGRRATTHWRYADALAQMYPKAQIDPDVLYVDEGRILTSAGSAAGIDMGLHVIRRDHGAGKTNLVARRLVVSPHREGGQKQFIERPIEPDSETQAFSMLLDHLRAHPDEATSLVDMAQRVHMSTRTFVRRFRAATGTTPMRWLQRIRVQHAQTLLETTTLPLVSVAEQCGFTDPQLLRLHFRRVVGMSPNIYRQRFKQVG